MTNAEKAPLEDSLIFHASARSTREPHGIQIFPVFRIEIGIVPLTKPGNLFYILVKFGNEIRRSLLSSSGDEPIFVISPLPQGHDTSDDSDDQDDNDCDDGDDSAEAESSEEL